MRAVRLVGSRRRDTATELSDWDFAVDVEDFEAVAAELPELVAPLHPLAQQWDALSERDTCYMLMLRGPIKVDLIFDRPREPSPPWTVSREDLPRIDHHFWDWIRWIASKQAAGRQELVRQELAKMSSHLLEPVGIAEAPASVERAIALYTSALVAQEKRTGAGVSRELERAVRGALRRSGYGFSV